MSELKYKDEGWNNIFNKLNILQEIHLKNKFLISAKQIKDLSGKEPRRLCKNDTIKSLPKLFQEEKLSILPIKNGQYIIYKDPEFKSFARLSNFSNIKLDKYKVQSHSKLITLNKEKLTSESKAIDYASNYGLLNHYCNDKLVPTIRGREYSEEFDFLLDKNTGTINVKSVQIEVDSGFEGDDTILLIEGKNSTRASFNIRQLYYPFRHYSIRTKQVKKIKNVLLCYSNGIYYLTELVFGKNYYDYTINPTSAFVIEEPSAKKINLSELLLQPIFSPNTDIPIPQADDLNKIVDLVLMLNTKTSMNKHDVADSFEFDERQGDYYSNAGRYLGFIKKENQNYTLTNLGKKLSTNKSRKERSEILISQILKIDLFNEIMSTLIKNDLKIDRNLIIKCLEKKGLIGSTAARRSSTIKSWINWVKNEL